MIELETQDVMQIFIRGSARAQTRARHVQKGNTVVTYSSATKGLKKWRADLIAQLKIAKRDLGLDPLEGALCVDMVFLMAIKQKSRWGQICYTKPDKDNLEKAVLDCMEKAGLFAVSDSQVGVGQQMKVWCAPGDEGAEIKLKRVRVAKKIPADEGGDNLDWLA